MQAPTSSHVVVIYSLKYSFISSHSLFLSCNHNLPFLSPLSHHPTLSILPLQLWAMHVPLCRSWLQVWLSCRGSLTPWWSRHFLESFCKFLPCRVSSWLLSTSCSVWQKLLSPLRVSGRLTVMSPFVHIILICETSIMWHISSRRHAHTVSVVWQAPSFLSSSPRTTSEGSPCTSSLCPMEGDVFSVPLLFSWCTFSLEVKFKQTNRQENTNTGLTNDIEALVLNTVVLCYRKLLPKHTAWWQFGEILLPLGHTDGCKYPGILECVIQVQ